MLRMFTVFDKAVGSFGQPFFCRASGEAVRTFTDAVNDVQSPFYKHPADFELYFIGAFNQQSGEIAPAVVERVVAALDVLNKM